MTKFKKKPPFLEFLLFLILPFFTLIVLIQPLQNIQKFFTHAFSKKADLVIDRQAVLGELPKPWQAVAQGGEERKNMLANVIPEIRQIKPEYIRIDHIYDFYDVVEKRGNELVFDFSRLDRVVDSILASGAKPFFSLSYMPPAIASKGTNSAPESWWEWKTLVKKTIQHYSGYHRKNIPNVYYEVWNEPDLFGNWKTWGDKNYLALYFWAATGAMETQNVNDFKLGGPATTGFYPNWIEKLLTLTRDKNLKLDFLSWHRYHTNPEKFLKDCHQADNIIRKTLGNQYVEKIISEWGSDSQKNPIHDTHFDAAHTIATVKQISGNVKHAFAFEIKDGPSLTGKKYYGGWGMLTHELAGKTKKPRFYSLALLSQLEGQELYVQGENRWIKAIAANDSGRIRALITNYDPHGWHQEFPTITFKNLVNGYYLVRKTNLGNQISQERVKIENNTYSEKFFLGPNQVVLVELISLLSS